MLAKLYEWGIPRLMEYVEISEQRSDGSDILQTLQDRNVHMIKLENVL